MERKQKKEIKPLKKGDKFYNLIVVDEKSTYKNKQYFYLCKCLLCGKEKYIQKYNLVHLKIKSCGCLKYKYGKGTNKRLNKIFNHMINRCYNPNNINYHRYGKKNITICNEWLKDRNIFFKWAFENGYNNNLSIDRIDGTKGYYPDNCRWATAKQQARNLCTNKYITIDGKTKLLCEWAEEYHLHSSTIIKRIKRGKTGKDLIKSSNFKKGGVVNAK